MLLSILGYIIALKVLIGFICCVFAGDLINLSKKILALLLGYSEQYTGHQLDKKVLLL